MRQTPVSCALANSGDTVNTRELLAQLIQFDTVSRNPNKALMEFLTQWLAERGLVATLIPNQDGSKANLYVSTGPMNTRGIMLSGHTDVVPVDGQQWTVPAFELTERDERYYGRGTTDMKGFVACALNLMAKAQTLPLQQSLHLALSYDEEIGCVGVRSLIEHLQHKPLQPWLCIVGEPTQMNVATRHKGKCAASVTFTGREGHSALAPHALNAIHLANDFISLLREMQAKMAEPYANSHCSDIPYSTLHAGLISGGTAINMVPGTCRVDFEIRNAAGDNAMDILNSIIQRTESAVAKQRVRIPEANATFTVLNEYPGLDTPEHSRAVQFVKSLTGANGCTDVAFGTEAGLFSERLSIPAVVCGPGSMDQGHKPDEFISIDQMTQCEAMLDRLLDFLCQPTPGTA